MDGILIQSIISPVGHSSLSHKATSIQSYEGVSCLSNVLGSRETEREKI